MNNSETTHQCRLIIVCIISAATFNIFPLLAFIRNLQNSQDQHCDIVKSKVGFSLVCLHDDGCDPLSSVSSTLGCHSCDALHLASVHLHPLAHDIHPRRPCLWGPESTQTMALSNLEQSQYIICAAGSYVLQAFIITASLFQTELYEIRKYGAE